MRGQFFFEGEAGQGGLPFPQAPAFGPIGRATGLASSASPPSSARRPFCLPPPWGGFRKADPVGIMDVDGA
jgi:hypothetical protein